MMARARAAPGAGEGDAMSGQSAVVSGASTGIGEATALHLDRMGFRVFAGVRRESAGEALRARASERLVPLPLDVTDAASIAAAAKTVASAVGDAGLDGLVNNAGIGIAGSLEFLDLDRLREQLEVNVVGAVAVTQAFLPLLRRATGRIVQIGSMAGYSANPFLGPYAASKHALEGLSDSLRRELRPWRIEVSIVEPGSIETPIWGKAWEQADELRAGAGARELELYGEAFERMVAFMKSAAGRAIPAQRVADSVHHALTAARPRTRYRVGRDAQVALWLTRLLPARGLDALLGRIIGLPRPR
jgi:NAD(P)-dependent dehydrogenase (short-subunit alcohol dehydrogenase family)